MKRKLPFRCFSMYTFIKANINVSVNITVESKGKEYKGYILYFYAVLGVFALKIVCFPLIACVLHYF